MFCNTKWSQFDGSKWSQIDYCQFDKYHIRALSTLNSTILIHLQTVLDKKFARIHFCQQNI